MRTRHRPIFTVAMFLLACAVYAQPSELTVHNLTMPPGETAGVTVSGRIVGEWTFGVNIMVEIVPKPGAAGSVRFTPSPPVDIVQLGDPWPGVGTFSPLDVDVTYSDALNGSVDDDGIFIPAPVAFSGDLGWYPIAAGEDARGVWDVNLSTSAGESGWQGLPTTLTSGTITILSAEGIPAMSAWTHLVMVLLLLTAGTVIARHRARRVRRAGRTPMV